MDEPYKLKIAKLSFDDALRDLAVTIYHEARHCQQDFWMMSLYFSYKRDYTQFSELERFIDIALLQSAREIAEKTPFPNDDRVLSGIHHLFIFLYWYKICEITKQPSGESFVADANKAQYEAAKLRGVTLDQAAQMAAYEPGYFSRYHEEDAYATEDAVRQYREDGDRAKLLNSGVCTSRYESVLKKNGVRGNG